VLPNVRFRPNADFGSVQLTSKPAIIDPNATDIVTPAATNALAVLM
jgi:hypothetical protein